MADSVLSLIILEGSEKSISVVYRTMILIWPTSLLVVAPRLFFVGDIEGNLLILEPDVKN